MTVTIDPNEWLTAANQRAPKVRGKTPWFPGATQPDKCGWYERHFTDSTLCGPFFHYWDGEFWSAQQGGKPHWRQVGDYPAWRGLTFHAFLNPHRYPGATALQNTEGEIR
jgi:hypothetical protein